MATDMVPRLFHAFDLYNGKIPFDGWLSNYAFRLSEEAGDKWRATGSPRPEDEDGELTPQELESELAPRFGPHAARLLGIAWGLVTKLKPSPEFKERLKSLDRRQQRLLLQHAELLAESSMAASFIVMALSRQSDQAIEDLYRQHRPLCIAFCRVAALAAATAFHLEQLLLSGEADDRPPKERLQLARTAAIGDACKLEAEAMRVNSQELEALATGLDEIRAKLNKASEQAEQLLREGRT